MLLTSALYDLHRALLEAAGTYARHGFGAT